MRYTLHRGGSNQAASGQTSEAAPDRPVVYALLTSFRFIFSPHTFQRLPFARADSKRQRVPALFRPLHLSPK
jgi:hypothetical protein